MKAIASTLACFALLTAGYGFARPDKDTCHVYVIDVKATREFRERTDLDLFMRKSKQEQEAIMKAAGVGKTYDEFAPKVGEEELTTRSYPFPKGKQIITASIFYTDESMASTYHQESMIIGISVGAKAFDNALEATDAAIAEVSYGEDTDAVRVKKNVVVDGRQYIVGLECRCKNDKPK
jgi:hypothetical protein